MRDSNYIFPNKSLDCISSELGIIKSLYGLARNSNDPYYYNYAMSSANINYLLGKNTEYSLATGGCGLTQSDAYLGLVGETLERYSSAFFNPKEKILSSYQQLNKEAIAPDKTALFHTNQYKNKDFHFHPYTNDIEISWFPMYNLCTGVETYYPGQFIFMPYQEDENNVTNGNSTGLATHSHVYKAILGAIYEVIERDCFALTWYQKIKAPKIKITKAITEYIEGIFPTKCEFHLFDISYDWPVKTIFGLCLGETEFGKFVICASASRHTHTEAIKKVLQELGQGIPYTKFLIKENASWEPKIDYSDVNNFSKHAALYLKKPLLAEESLTYLIEAEPTLEIKWEEQETLTELEKITNIIKHCKSKGYSVLFKDLTTVDLEQLGFKSIRICIPEAIPLSGSFGAYFFGAKRLYEVPKNLGYPCFDYENLNPLPHLFP
ncbi:MAG: YcaO-like family protein [Sphingobacteriaceae bacterium]|nr:YcaO-like family protein [Sphingobacteriaceae bacterium]